MIRLFTTRGFTELWKCSNLVVPRVIKRHVVSLFPASSACHNRVSIPTRHFNAGSPREREKIDLDKWKSVMRSQAASAERQDIEEEEASDEDDIPKEPGGGLKDTLEATRDLVVMWRQAGKLVPEEMTDEEVQILAELTTKSSRKKYLKYLAIKEGHKKARKEKQQQKRTAREASLEQKRDQEGDDQRELRNTFLLQFWSRTEDRLLGWRSTQAMLFGQPLVIDMSYESNMSRREIENTVSQLMEVEGWNRRATEPYHLHFCNLKQDGGYKNELLKRYGAEAWDRLLITSSNRPHVDLFPREQLVYLTADSPNVLRTFDHSKVYIIGALVDRSIQSGLSLANAKRLKLATARLPLDEFLHWEIGAKNLTLDQMIRIMLTVKDTGNWEEALDFVPKRKHDGFHSQQKEIRRQGPRETSNKIMRSREQNGKNAFRSGDQGLYMPHKDSRFTGMGPLKSKPAATRVRTSFNSNIEGRKNVGKSKTWFDDE